MKKFILLLISCVSLYLYAQTTDAPEKVRVSFNASNPGVSDIKWSRDSVNYKVSFTDKDKLQHIVVYGKDGKVLRSERQLVSKDIPTSINQYYTDKYPDEKTYTVWEVTDSEGNKTYYTNRKDETIYFDKSGNISKDVAPSIH